MAFYGTFDGNGYLTTLSRSTSAGAVQLTKTEVLTVLNPSTARMRRLGPDDWTSKPIDETQEARVYEAKEKLRLSSDIAQAFIEERLAIMLDSTVITSTTLPTAFGLELLEFRYRLRQFLLKRREVTDPIPDIPEG